MAVPQGWPTRRWRQFIAEHPRQTSSGGSCSARLSSLLTQRLAERIMHVWHPGDPFGRFLFSGPPTGSETSGP